MGASIGGNNHEVSSSHLLMDPHADVETTSTASAPGRYGALRGGVAGAQTGEAYERHAAEINDFLVRTLRDSEAAADLVADAWQPAP